MDHVFSRPPVRKVVFEAYEPEAREVVIIGDFTGWMEEGIRLGFRGNGLWTTVLLLEPGEYQYRLRIDGEWKDDTQAVLHRANAGGSVNCALVVK